MMIAVGGAVGSVLRYIISKWLNEQGSGDFPWGTFVVNVVGCLIIGLVYAIEEKTGGMEPQLKLFLTVGLCGGFTTFSTFCNESFLLLRHDQLFLAALYAAASLFAGILAVYIGMRIAG